MKKPHCPQGIAKPRRWHHMLATLAITALLSFGSLSAFANSTDQNTASPPVQVATADQIVLDTSAPPLDTSSIVVLSSTHQIFVAENTPLASTAPPDIIQQLAIIINASPQKNDGYANQSAATQQSGGFGMNIGATYGSPPANVTFTGTIADTSPGIFALIS